MASRHRFLTTARRSCDFHDGEGEPEGGAIVGSHHKSPAWKNNAVTLQLQRAAVSAEKQADFEEQHGPCVSVWCKEHRQMKKECGCQ